MPNAALSSQLLPQLCQYWPEEIGFRSLVLKTEMLSLTECYFVLSHVWAYKCLGQHPIFHSFGETGHIYELHFKNLLLQESSWLKSKGNKKYTNQKLFIVIFNYCKEYHLDRKAIQTTERKGCKKYFWNLVRGGHKTETEFYIIPLSLDIGRTTDKSNSNLLEFISIQLTFQGKYQEPRPG